MLLPTAPPELTISVPNFGDKYAHNWRALIDVAQAAERAGVNRLGLADHIVLGDTLEEYPWGDFPTSANAPWLEPLTTIAALAGATEKIRLAPLVLIAPLRQATHLAKTVATIDVISGGRVDIGVSTGWHRAEYEALGVDFNGRGTLLADTIRACRAFWETSPTSFEMPRLSVREIYCEPKPTQGRIPVWFGGSLHKRNVQRIVELGDGWVPVMGSTIEQVAEGRDLLRHRFEEAGRDPGTLQIQCSIFTEGEDELGQPLQGELGARAASISLNSVHESDSLLDKAETLWRSGATDINIYGLCSSNLDETSDTFAKFARLFRARFA